MGVLFNDETRLLMHEDKKYVRKFFFLMENKLKQRFGGLRFFVVVLKRGVIATTMNI